MASGEDLVRDTLFQINTLVWACTDCPSTEVVRPILREHGFLLEAFDLPTAISTDVLRRVSPTLDCGVAPEPDAAIWNPIRRIRLLVECKAQSFSASSTNSRQCRALLLAAGHNTATPLIPEAGETFASYLLPEAWRALQESTLRNLTSELQPLVFPDHCGMSFVFGLQWTNASEVRLHVSAGPTPFQGFPAEGMVILKATSGELPIPLFQVAICPDALNGTKLNSDYASTVFFYRLVSQLVFCMNGQENSSRLLFDTEKVLIPLVGGLYGLWTESRKRPMRNFTHHAIYKVLREVTTKKSIQTANYPQGHLVHLEGTKASTLRSKLLNLLEQDWTDVLKILEKR